VASRAQKIKPVLHFYAVKPQNPVAQRFEQTRRAHRSELAEDYVEAILELTEEQGEARTTNLALRIGVAHPTVAKALRRLQKEGLVELSPYRPVTLTREGRRLAHDCRKRHRVVVEFLVALGLKPEGAELEAEGIEHHVGAKTLRLMERFSQKSGIKTKRFDSRDAVRS
jgi:DtxR family manganese transport transcriptional regulator